MMLSHEARSISDKPSIPVHQKQVPKESARVSRQRSHHALLISDAFVLFHHLSQLALYFSRQPAGRIR